jgi:transaldolase
MRDAAADLASHGVSIWLDDLSREGIESGHLGRLVRDRHVTGVTTNPTIFHRAITSSGAYDAELRKLALRGVDASEAVRSLTTADVRSAADIVAPVHRRTSGFDGWVSIEVDPRLSQDAHRTLGEARQLAEEVDRPNVFVKIPATDGSLPAIADALAEGINVNVTLIFSLSRYVEVLDAFLDGMERALAAGRDLSRTTSVASIFLSRVDTAVDERLDAMGTQAAAALRGTAAIAGARLAFAHHQAVMSTPRWAALAAAGARPQRLLWASTGVKDRDYEDTRYVVELVARGIINTMPESMLDAVMAHGVVRGDTLRGTADAAAAVMSALNAVGVDIPDVMAGLENAAVQQFTSTWSRLHAAVGDRLVTAGSDGAPRRPAGADVRSG